MSNIKTVTYIGKHQTYDLEVDHKNHQYFLENGVLTSNSHAVSYAFDSYMCAWLLTHYEEEWLTSYIESQLSSPDKKEKALQELKKLGYTIEKLDVNYSDLQWKISNKKCLPSLLSCKGIGEAAIEELMTLRPFSSIEEMLYNEDGSWRLSKFNKRALEALIKVKAFDSLNCVGEGKLFDSYKHMYEVVIENMNQIKKSTKKDPQLGRKMLYELAKSLRPMQEWTRKELADFSCEVFGSLDIDSLLDENQSKKLIELNINPINELIEDGTDIVWFVVHSAFFKKTQGGKQYLQCMVSGPNGKTVRLMVWGAKVELEQYNIYVAEVKKDSWGYSTNHFKVKTLSAN